MHITNWDHWQISQYGQTKGTSKNIGVGASLSQGNNHTKGPTPHLDQLNMPEASSYMILGMGLLFKMFKYEKPPETSNPWCPTFVHVTKIICTGSLLQQIIYLLCNTNFSEIQRRFGISDKVQQKIECQKELYTHTCVQKYPDHQFSSQPASILTRHKHFCLQISANRKGFMKSQRFYEVKGRKLNTTRVNVKDCQWFLSCTLFQPRLKLKFSQMIHP